MLTRRGRVVLAGLAIVVAVSALGFLGLSAASGAQASRGGPSLAMVHRNLTEVVVRPGDTLWAIAMRAQPAADARIVIQQIVDLNALRGTDIQPGERLWVPRG